MRFGYIAGIALTVAMGALLLHIGDGLRRFSYDWPFIWKKSPAHEDDGLIMVYINSNVKSRLGQATDQPLDRSFYIPLLKRLHQDGVRLVLFDLVFDAPSKDPVTDEKFAEAIRSGSPTVLVAEERHQTQENVPFEIIIPPIRVLAEASAGFGLANVDEDKVDRYVRRLYPGSDTHPSVSWVAASLLGATATKNADHRLRPRWLNYYEPPRNVRSVSLDQVASEPPGHFRDKIVIIGAGGGDAVVAGEIQDTFGHPFSRWGAALSPGANIHAFSLLNLLRGDWLHYAGSGIEMVIVVAWGIFTGVLFMKLRPWPAIGAALLCAVLLASLAAYIHLLHHVWFSWAVSAGPQTGIALVWAVGYRYMIESRRRERLRRAVAAYVSPHMADEIANSNFDLSPGGKELEATVMFTDLEGFTTFSETLPPTEVSRILISYFNETTRAIFDQDGTVIKFIGDAVMAVWGAPLPTQNPAERAVIAACKINEKEHQEIAGRKFRTRIGINTGTVLAGNLGSDTKFDYTVIGDVINVAARLESLNKQLGTRILIAEATRAQLSPRVRLRKLGRFLVAGRAAPVEISEVLALESPDSPEQAWIKFFDQATDYFATGDFPRAEELFQEVIRAREGKDGPSQFFLKQIHVLKETSQRGENWDGVVKLDAK